MTDKARFEEIKEEYRWNVSCGNALPVSHSDIEWLFQQAERALNGEEELDMWLSGKNVAISTYGQLKGLNEENERLRGALELIIRNTVSGHVENIARRALNGDSK